MHDSICAFPSKTLYHSRLKSHPSVASHLLHGLPNAQAKSDDEEKELLKTPVVFFDTAGCEYYEKLDGDADEGSRYNENEATIVSNWVDRLVSFLSSLAPSHDLTHSCLGTARWRGPPWTNRNLNTLSSTSNTLKFPSQTQTRTRFRNRDCRWYAGPRKGSSYNLSGPEQRHGSLVHFHTQYIYQTDVS